MGPLKRLRVECTAQLLSRPTREWHRGPNAHLCTRGSVCHGRAAGPDTTWQPMPQTGTIDNSDSRCPPPCQARKGPGAILNNLRGCAP